MQKINVIRKWIILEFKTTFFINSSCSFIDESYSDSIDPAEVETITTGFERLAGYPAQLHCSRLITRWLLRNSSFSNCNGHQSSIFRWVDNSSKLFFDLLLSHTISTRHPYKASSLSVESMHSTRAINTKAVLTTYRRILNKCL